MDSGESCLDQVQPTICLPITLIITDVKIVIPNIFQVPPSSHALNTQPGRKNQAAVRTPKKPLACTTVFGIFVQFRVNSGTHRKCSFCIKKLSSEIAATKPKVLILQVFSHEPIQTPTGGNTSTKVVECSESIAFGSRDSEL